jgi:hypothetical protein
MEGEDKYAADFELGNGDNEMPQSYNPAKLQLALRSLSLLGDDPYLSMQVTNVAIVDDFLVQVEAQAAREHIKNDRVPIDQLTFLSAQTQMWLFAMYELLRTWRQRVSEALKLEENGGLQLKIDYLRQKDGPADFGSQVRARQLEVVRDDPAFVEKLRSDERRVHVIFRTIEALRVSIAKHEVAGIRNSIAFMPGYARLDLMTGSLRYELSMGTVIYDYVSRRGIADSIRAVLDRDAPTAEEIESYEEWLRSLRTSPPDLPTTAGFRQPEG